MQLASHRYGDWEDRLRTYLDRVNDEPFRWGRHDCALFAADCIRAMTGFDPGEAFRGRYDTKTGAAEALREFGAGTLLRTVVSWLGKSKSIHLAQRGDIVMNADLACGICVGPYSYFVGEGPGQVGLIPVPTASLKYAFSVPFEASEGETWAK
jgi:hypothetical protein